MKMPSILIIEDDEKVKNTIEDTAHSLGYMCDWANNQDDALRLLNLKDYEIVLLDLQIPPKPLRNASIDYGCNCLEQIRLLKDKKTLPVIIMTTHTNKGLDLARKLLQLGANDFISKPFDAESRTLNHVLRSFSKGPIQWQHIPQLQNPQTDKIEQNPAGAWLTVTQAAQLLVKDLGVELSNAQARISKAASRGEFQTNGLKNRARRIEANSFSTWRIRQRDLDLDKEDDHLNRHFPQV